jgi:hypothetical protein
VKQKVSWRRPRPELGCRAKGNRKIYSLEKDLTDDGGSHQGALNYFLPKYFSWQVYFQTLAIYLFWKVKPCSLADATNISDKLLFHLQISLRSCIYILNSTLKMDATGSSKIVDPHKYSNYLS